ncbi:MAG: ribosomal RNA small subunit methyltransferase A, partial [Gemmatimonadales bacterium]
MSPRRLGQHFLSEPAILARIADALDPRPGELVLEIGPGRGTLTQELLARGLRVVAIEKDRGLAAALSARDNLTVVAGDALELDWHSYGAAKVIGNIPYYI